MLITLCALDRLAGLGEALEHGLALADLLVDLRGVGGRLVRGLRAIARAAAAAQAVAHAAPVAVHVAHAVEHLAELVHPVGVHAVLRILDFGHGGIERLHLLELLGHLGELLLAHPEGLGGLFLVALLEGLLGLAELAGELLELLQALGLLLELLHLALVLLLGQAAILEGLVELLLPLLHVGQSLSFFAISPSCSWRAFFSAWVISPFWSFS